MARRYNGPCMVSSRAGFSKVGQTQRVGPRYQNQKLDRVVSDRLDKELR